MRKPLVYLDLLNLGKNPEKPSTLESIWQILKTMRGLTKTGVKIVKEKKKKS